jgi:hypothetical protein
MHVYIILQAVDVLVDVLILALIASHFVTNALRVWEFIPLRI